jgi:hypothetical protein
LCACPARRPRRAGALGCSTHQCCLPAKGDCRPLMVRPEPGRTGTTQDFEALSRGLRTPLSTLRGNRSPGFHARLGSRRSPTLPGWALHPLGSNTKFQRDVTSWHSLHPGLSWRTPCPCPETPINVQARSPLFDCVRRGPLRSTAVAEQSLVGGPWGGGAPSREPHCPELSARGCRPAQAGGGKPRPYKASVRLTREEARHPPWRPCV